MLSAPQRQIVYPNLAAAAHDFIADLDAGDVVAPLLPGCRTLRAACDKSRQQSFDLPATGWIPCRATAKL
jgi:hypothetical protein